jgi:hypothetical protein
MFLQTISVLMMCVFSVILVKIRVVDSGWNEGEYRYEIAEEIILAHGAEEEDVIVAVNPPAYNAMTGRSAIVIPDGDILTLLNAARRFEAGYVILEEDRSPELFTTLTEELQLHPEFIDIGGFDGVRIYAIRSTK